jgi:membrane-associated phospholipid phosphatase
VPAPIASPLAAEPAAPNGDGGQHAHRRVDLRRFPLGWGDAAWFVVAYAALCVVFIGIGELITHPLRNSAVQRLDLHIEQWLADHRTPWLNTATYIGSELADTVVKIAVTAIVAGTMLAVWRRWLEPLMVSVALVLEAAVFITTTWTVGRPRPDVQRLETSPIGSSFPSGHVAAAMVYGAIAVVVCWHTRRTWLRVLAFTVVGLVAIFAGFSRMYRGMHHLTDVIAGALLGAAAVAITCWLLVRAARRREAIPDGLTISDTVGADRR